MHYCLRQLYFFLNVAYTKFKNKARLLSGKGISFMKAHLASSNSNEVRIFKLSLTSN